jgi:hypothetical protein
MREEIKTSRYNSKFQIIAVSLVGLILIIFTAQLLKSLDNIVQIDLSRLTNIARILIAGATAFGVYMSWKEDKRYKYYLTKDSIIIQKTIFGKLREDIYNARNITSISVKQSAMGVKNNYGTLIINSDKLYNNQSIFLNNIVDPKQVADKVNNFLGNNH